MSPIEIVYCTKSDYKIEEWGVARDVVHLNSCPIGQLFEFDFRKITTHEPLLCDLAEMARFKVKSAYEVVKVPCLVEHAGLILEGFESESFPGGLTQPMWDALNAESFVRTTLPLSSRAVARAVIGYCDGMNVHTFSGETSGTLTAKPRGDRGFYWDPIFCPDDWDGKTYAEIAGEGPEGLRSKVQISQSIKALKKFMSYRLGNEPRLFPGL